MQRSMPHYLVDFDGTLSYSDGLWHGFKYTGPPVPLMVARVRKWLDEGKLVKIFTARMEAHGQIDSETGEIIDVVTPIQRWCLRYFGQALEVTNVKTMSALEIWDDRAVQVEHNTGRFATFQD